jgi:hypothetical protein
MRLSRVCGRAAARGAFVMVSGLFHREILDLYKKWWAWKIDRRSQVSCDIRGRRTVSEVVIMNRRPSVACATALHLQRIE